MEQNFFKISKNKEGLTLHGVDIPDCISPNEVFYTTPSYSKHIHTCTPRVISIPPQLEYEGEQTSDKEAVFIADTILDSLKKACRERK